MKTFDEYFMEEKLDAKDREKIKEDDWGVIIKDDDGNIIEKAYPMPDAQHVISAARMYPFAKRKYDAKVVAELRRKIIAKAKEYNVPDSRIQSVIDDTPGGKSKPVKEYKESVIYEAFVNGCNQIFLEGNKTQYQRTMNRWNYDPTTGTIKTDIPDPRSTNGETMRVKLVVDNTRGPFIRIPRDANGNRLYDKAEIHVPRKVLKSKGWNVDTIMKHEEGHMAAKMNRDQYSDDFNKAQQQIDANKHALMGNAHGNNPEEYVVDKYAAQHSRFGKRGAIKALQRTYRTYNEVAKSSKTSSKQINAMELLTVELRQHKISVDEYYKKQMDLLRNCQETLSVREGNLRALQKALVSESNDPKTVAYCNERIEAATADIARLKTELENGCKEFDSDNEKFLSDPNTYNMLIDRVNARCKQMKIYDRDAKIKEGQLRVAFLQNNVQESVGPEEDFTTGTSEFDETYNDDPDDCYTEAYDAITGEEIPIDHAYTMDEMKEITLSFTESKNDSIHMRPATKADLDRMYRWEMESIDKELQKDPKVQKLIREDVEQSIKDTQMIMDGRVTVGMFTACMIDDGEWRYIGEIYLIPSYRGRGIGSGILRKEIEQYPKIRLQVATSNDKAIKLYKSLGFKIVKENKKQKMYLMEYIRDTIQESTLPIEIKGIAFRPAEEKDLPNIIQWKLDEYNESRAVQESSNIHDETFYRYEYEGEGIYEALRKQLTSQEWKSFKQSDAAKWLPIPPDYEKGDESFFTEKGNEKFKKNTLPYIKKHLKPSQIRSYDCNLNSKYIRYRDEYQVVYNKTKTFQESVIQNIKNKTSPFEKNLVYHISPDGHLDGQIFKPRVPDYLDKYDPSKTEFEDVETPRVCFSPSIEGCLNAIIVNIGRWKTADKLRDWYVYIPEKPLKEYKYRTNKQLVDEKKVYDANITKEIWIEEPVRLKQYGIIRIDSVTDKNRKKAVPTTTGESKKRNVYDFKWHWLVKPKVLKDVPYDYSPLEVCKDMVADLGSYKYGIPENGKIVGGSEHDYDTKWKLQSPEEFEKNKGGICFDYVEFEEGYLDAYGIKCKKYFMSTNLPGNDTHTFILVDDGKGGFIYPESSFEKVAGTHEVKSVEEAIKIVADGFWKINDNINKTNKFKYYVWEYNGHPKYGSNIQKCIEYYSKGEPFFESRCLKPGKSKPIHEFVTHFRNT